MRKRTRASAKFFTSPPFRHALNELVWEIVARIPRGRVTTYGQIASIIPKPPGVSKKHFLAARARWVGNAMAACPPDLPWHRVINSQGKISIRSRNNHHLVQRKRLEAEGITFDERGRTDLSRFQWHPKLRD